MQGARLRRAKQGLQALLRSVLLRTVRFNLAGAEDGREPGEMLIERARCLYHGK